MTAYYNEFEPFAAAWLRELIADGLIADGEVDDRSILDVRPDDLRGYDQCHFFAGIGGWSHALRLAGWPDDRPVWTGSCPCQPLSSAGQQKGHEDERHIWPAFYGLIAECQPTTVFGEQVGSKLGLEWLAGVRADLESSGYACGAADLPAAGVGAPHIRQRLWWVGHADSERQPAEVTGVRQGLRQPITGGGAASRVADNIGERSHAAKSITGTSERLHGSAVTADEGNGMADASDRRVRGVKPNDGLPNGQASTAVRAIQDGGMADADSEGLEGYKGNNPEITRPIYSEHGSKPPDHTWASGELIPCADGKARRTQPGIFPLAYGIPNRMGTLRGAGNAIVPQVASVFITAYMESEQ